MKTIRIIIRITFICVVLLLCVVGLSVVSVKLEMWHVRKTVTAQDPQILLAACRDLIDRKSLFFGEGLQNILTGTNSIMLLPSGKVLPKDVPGVVKDLNPKRIIIAEEHVFIRLSNRPRIEMVGFSTNAFQFGDERLADGLWLIFE